MTLRLKIVRIILILPAYIKSYFCEPLLPPALMPTHQQFVSYREKVRGTFQELFARYGSEYDLSDMTKKEQKIFKNKV